MPPKRTDNTIEAPMALVVHSAKLWDDASSTGNSIDDSTTCIVTRAIQIDAAVASRFLANEHHDSTSMNGRSDHTDFSAALDSIANDTRTSILCGIDSILLRGELHKQGKVDENRHQLAYVASTTIGKIKT